MSKTSRLEQVEQECKERGVRLIYDDVRSEGGLCRLRGSYYVILNRRLASETKTRIIVDALARVGDCTRTVRQGHLTPMGTVPKTESDAAVSDRVPSTPVPSSEPVEAPAPLSTPRPEFEYEEPEVGVPVSAGIPDSQS